MVKKMPMGSFFEEQFVFARTFNALGLTDGEIGLLTSIMIMNPGEWKIYHGKIPQPVEKFHSRWKNSTAGGKIPPVVENSRTGGKFPTITYTL